MNSNHKTFRLEKTFCIKEFGVRISIETFSEKIMLETYKAKIHGDKIEWETDAPEILSKETSVDVIVTILDEKHQNSELRPFGLSKGDFVVPDDFDAPLPEEILASFEK
jgi:hypothetical protein